MPVRIRLQRFGRKKVPFYRIVSCDSRSRRDGKFLEVLGTYDPLIKNGQKEVRLNIDRCRYWLGVGAQPSDVVQRLFGQFGVLPPHVHKRQRQTSIPKNQREFSTSAINNTPTHQYLSDAIINQNAAWAISNLLIKK
ncbi:hypothetical protein TrLO_g5960 [Triparma laevis f. longispina]|uniref:Ribosomal protein S16 n=1 Tax=Triparma laevis f. longispina TaxID=1714387 RepID=A0A9W7DW70_9STRA|nr:hypothetical protein TrLO_g5960 [Triparma laevis f. longispina]